jgi:hypothetical protein
MGLSRLFSNLQLSMSVLKTKPTQVPVPWLALTLSQRLAQRSGVVSVIQAPRKLPAA